MALTTALRNVGVGLVIVTGNFAGTPAVSAALAYGIVEGSARSCWRCGGAAGQRCQNLAGRPNVWIELRNEAHLPEGQERPQPSGAIADASLAHSKWSTWAQAP